MYGHEGVARDLKRRLETRLPVRLGMARATRDLTHWELPNPIQVLPYFDPDIDVDNFPTVAVTELDTPNGLTGARVVRQGLRHDAFVYRYPNRIVVYLMGEHYGQLELQLKRYLTVIREVLLEDRVLTDTDAAYVIIDAETITEDFDSPLEDEARQILATGFVGVVLESTEVIDRDTLMGEALPVVGEVHAADRFTGEPTGAPSPIVGEETP